MTKRAEVARGLDGVVVAESAICHIDGERGELLYRGYTIGELADRASFEEVAALLWQGELPGRRSLARLAEDLAEARRLPRDLVDHLRIMPRRALPIDVARTLVSLLGSYDREAGASTGDAGVRKAARVAGALAAGIAAFHRIRSQLPVLEPRPDLGHAASFLWQLHGEVPTREDARAFEQALVLHMEHGFNASTFAARVAASTLADLHAALSAAVAALKGPLHGGANEKVMAMLAEIGEPRRASDWVRARVASKERIMGFGHRVYKTEDPRAAVLRRLGEERARAKGQGELFAVAKALEQAVVAELGARGIAVNVDFYSASLYHLLGIPHDLFTAVFAIARVVGWSAHVLEQQADNRLIRPRSTYAGPARRPVPPLDERDGP